MSIHANIRIVVPFVVAIMIVTIPSYAFASNPIGDTLCAVIYWFTHGTVGVGLASISIFVTGIAALMNKITWGMFIFASLDVVLIFGAAEMVVALGGLDSC